MSKNAIREIEKLEAEISEMIDAEEYEQAIPVAQRWVQMIRDTYGPDDEKYMEAIADLANFYHNVEDIENAEKLFFEALEICRKRFPDTEAMVGINYRLALISGEKEEYEEAIKYYEQAIETGRKVLGEENENFLIVVSSLAELYLQLEKYEDAELLYKWILEIKERMGAEEDSGYMEALGRLAMVYDNIGDTDQVERLYTKAYEICRHSFPDHTGASAFPYKLAKILEGKGNYDEAVRLYQEAVEAGRRVVGEGDLDFTVVLDDFAKLYLHRGDYESAEALFNESLETRKQILGKEHPDYVKAINEIASLYLDSEYFVGAERLYRELADVVKLILGEESLEYGIILNKLGYTYNKLENHKAAEPLYRKVLAIYRKELGTEDSDYIRSVGNLAFTYHHMGNYGAAETLYKEALEAWNHALGEAHPHYSTCLQNIATAYVAMHRQSEGLAMMKQSMSVDDRMISNVFSFATDKDRLAFLSTLDSGFNAYLSLVYQYFPDNSEEVQYALDVVLRRKGIAAEALAAQRDAILGGKYPKLASKLEELSQLRMQIARKVLEGPGPEGLEAHERFLRHWDNQKERLESELSRKIPEMNLDKRLQSADRQAIASALPKGSVLVEFVRFHPFDSKAIPAKGEKEQKPPRYLAFVILAGEPDNISMIDLGEAELIDKLIARYRASISKGPEARAKRDMMFVESETGEIPGKDVGVELRTKVFDSLLEAIGDYKRLFIAPDGDLTKLPFEVLPLDDSNYLIDEYRISYVGVGRDVLRFEHEATGTSSAPLVIADPDFDLGMSDGLSDQRKYKNVIPISKKFLAREAAQISEDDADGPEAPATRLSRDMIKEGMRFNRLPGTRAEGEQIAAMLGTKPLMERMALEAKVKASESPKILHIASHGFFLADQERGIDESRRGMISLERGGPLGMRRLSASRLESPMLRSGLVLAGVNTWLKGGRPPAEAEDDILTAEDVSGLNLLNTELVVLSACETGLGEVKTGEGVFGLRRAFVLAGARTLVMSLWKVPDQQTQELMVEFYRRILDGKPRSDALREAQLEIKKKYPDPLYWGAFICQGDPGPLG